MDEEALADLSYGVQKAEKPVISREEKAVAVVEQRVSNLAQGSLCERRRVSLIRHMLTPPHAGLVLMTGPLQHVLGLIPKGVLAGLFWYMGSDALFGSGVTELFLFLIRDRYLTSPDSPLHKVRKSRIIIWLGFMLVGFAATFAITQTIAAIGESARAASALRSLPSRTRLPRRHRSAGAIPRNSSTASPPLYR